MIHVGEHIKRVIEAKEVSISSFAKEINRSRTVVYHIFNRESIDTNLLFDISKTLNYNFFQLYFPEEEFNQVDGISIEEGDSFKVKYYDLLERHNRLLEKIMKEGG